MGRPARYTLTQVQDAALAVLDRGGVDGLTMRAVASELGTGPMTLYTYVDSRADLEALVVEAVLRDVEVPTGREGDWKADTRAIATAVWRAVRPHPHAVPLILARRGQSASFLAVAEALLSALGRSGRQGHDLLVAFRAVSTLATAFAQNEIGGPLSGPDSGPATIRRFLELPQDRYPRLVEIADAARTSTPADEFARSLDALLDGLDR